MTRLAATICGDDVLIYCPATVSDYGDEWNEFIENASNNYLGLDVETVAFEDEFNAAQWDSNFAVRLVQVANHDTAFVLRADDPRILDILYVSSASFVTHSTYDAKSIFTQYGINVPNLIDSLVLSQMVYPDSFHDRKLKSLCSQHLDTGLAEAETELYKTFRAIYPDDTRRAVDKDKLAAYGFTNVPLDDESFLRYAGLDALYVRRLRDFLINQLVETSNTDVLDLIRYEMWMNDQCLDATVRGVKLDIDYTTEMRDAAAKVTTEADDRLNRLIGLRCSQGAKIAQWFEDQGCVFKHRTKSGAPSLANAKGHLDYQLAVETNEEAIEVLRTLKLAAEVKNTLTTTTGLLSFVDPDDRVHPEIKISQAKTSRMSITRPPLQTIKKNRDKEDSPMRKCFVVEDGYTLIGSDFEQVELRVAAALSGEHILIDILLEGRDLHSATAELMFGSQFTDAQRQICKTINFGILFGAGVDAVVTQTGISEDQARDAISMWRETYPQLNKCLRRWGVFAEGITTPNHRHIPADSGRTYANSNYMIQSTARELLKRAMFRFIEGRGHYGKLFLPIHDELIVVSDLANAEKMRADLEWAMCFDFLGVPIRAEAEIIGQRWGVAA